MHRAQPVGVQRERGVGHLSRGLQIDGLAADHADRARGAADDRDHAQLATLHGRVGGRRLAREQRERLRVKSVAGEDGDAVAVHGMQRRASTAQRVVVHGRQIVVNQRIRVNQLDRARARQRPIQQRRGRHSEALRNGVGGGQRQRGPQALATGEDAVAHRVADDRRTRGRQREVAFEGGVDLRANERQKVCERIGHGCTAVSRALARPDRATRARV